MKIVFQHQSSIEKHQWETEIKVLVLVSEEMRPYKISEIKFTTTWICSITLLLYFSYCSAAFSLASFLPQSLLALLL